MGIRKEGAYMSNIFMLNEAKFISSFDLRFQDGIVKTFVLNCNLGENDFAVLSSMDVLSEKECSQVYEEILDAARLSAKDSKKRVIIVKGGPGTGKSVVAVNLLAKLTREDQFCQYVSKNSAPRNVYLKKYRYLRKYILTYLRKYIIIQL